MAGSCLDGNLEPIDCDHTKAKYHDDLMFTEIDKSTGTAAQGAPDTMYNNRGELLQWDAAKQDWVPMGPDYTNLTQVSGYQAPKSTSYSVSQSYQDPTALAQNQQQIDNQASQYAASQAQAKEQWLGEQQIRMQTLDLQQQQLAQQMMDANRNYALAQQQQAFLQNKFGFEASQSIRAETRATQDQLFTQQSVVAQLQTQMVGIEQQAKQVNAQLQQETALFNAGKAADVSMFNVDQQTKTAMFNEQHAFNVQQANTENERLRQQQLIDVASRIAETAADPGDRGKLGAFLQALGGSGAGATDAALAGSDFRTPDSVTPLEAMLRQREDIQNSDPNPYTATPIVAQQAQFTPATAAQVTGPDFSKVAMPTPNTTPYDAAGAQAQANAVTASAAPGVAATGTGGYDAYKAAFIAGTVAESARRNDSTGAPLTQEERAAMPDIAIRGLYDTSSFPKMAAGGFAKGAYIGDEKGAEMHIPLPGGGRMVVPNDRVQQMLQQEQTRNSQPQPEQPGGVGGQPQQWNGAPRGMPQIDPRQRMSAGRTGQWNPQGGPSIQPVPNQPGSGNFDPFGGMGGGGASIPTGEQPGGGFAGAMDPRFASIIQAFMQSQGAGGMHRMADGRMMDNGGMHRMAEGGMMDAGGEIVKGPYMGDNDGAVVHIPIPGTDMTIMMPKPKGKGAKKTKDMPRHAAGGVFQNNGQSIYEGLLSDTDRTRATNFLELAGNRAAAQTGLDINRLPTPVGVSAPGTSRFFSDLVASLNAIRRGVPQDYFNEQSARFRPTAYSEGITGRTR